MIVQNFCCAALAAAVLMTAGCSSERFSDTSSPNALSDGIQAAPLDQISQSALPPPGGYPNAAAMPGQAQVAEPAMESSGIQLTSAGVAGVWKASVDGMTCQVATPQTKFGKGYRAGPLHCPVAFSSVNSWAVSGSYLVFYDNAGNNVATLYSSDGTRFEGQTVSGAHIVLSR